MIDNIDNNVSYMWNRWMDRGSLSDWPWATIPVYIEDPLTDDVFLDQFGSQVPEATSNFDDDGPVWINPQGWAMIEILRDSMFSDKWMPTMDGNAPRILAALLGLTVAACEAFQELEPPMPPKLEECWTPEEWVGQTCAELCEGEAASTEEDTGSFPFCVSPAPKCHQATVVGYKRHDACIDDQFAVPLEFGCDEPLPEQLTDQIYYVSCCCDWNS